MTLKVYRNYFEKLARQNIALSHNPEQGKKSYMDILIDDVVNQVSYDLTGICLFLEKPTIKPYDALSDNPRKIFNGGFLIMEPFKNSGDPDEKNLILERTEELTEDIISKIKNDQKLANNNKFYEFPIKGFDLNTVYTESVGQIFNDWYGWRTSFSINQTYRNNLILDASKWRTDKPSKIL